MTRVLALVAIVPAAATPYFAVFWTWFELWRRHRIATYAMMLGTISATTAAVVIERDVVLAIQLPLMPVARAFGWMGMALACALGVVADRQLGLHVRSFAPFFDPDEKIVLRTTGAYGIVRHPIYAAGIWFQVGAFLATGYVAVAIACAVLTLGALWFTREEERRLIERLEDPDAYARYRERVPALFPLWRFEWP